MQVHPAERIDLLIDVVKEELMQEATGFKVEEVQLWYDDADQKYQSSSSSRKFFLKKTTK